MNDEPSLESFDDDCIDEIQRWVNEGRDPNELTSCGLPMLRVVAHDGQLDAVNMLIQAGADVNYFKYTAPLTIASLNCHLHIVNRLLEAGADPNILNECEYSPLLAASESSHTSIARRLIEAGADVNRPDDRGITPLQRAAYHGNYEIVEMLLKAGANPNPIDIFNDTPILLAARTRHSKIVRILMEAGADRSSLKDYNKLLMPEYITLKDKEIERFVERWPAVVPLQVLCLRIVHYSPNKPTIPEWFPPLLLEWLDTEEYLLPDESSQRGKKRKLENEESETSKKRN